VMLIAVDDVPSWHLADTDAGDEYVCFWG